MTSEPILEYQFGVKIDDGKTVKFSVYCLENGIVRIRLTDCNGTVDHNAQWVGDGWEELPSKDVGLEDIKDMIIPALKHVEYGYDFKPDGDGNVVGNFYTKEDQ